MLWKGFQRPQKVEVDHDTLTETYGRFVAQPFERGFGTTIGNALRRCLLSSIEGAAITAVQVDGVLHEFSSIPGVVEDMTDIILNLKQIPIRLHSEDAKILSLDVTGPGEVTAGHLEGDSQAEIVNPDVRIATLNEEGHLKVQVKVERGRGYVSGEQNFDESLGIGWIPMDAVHSPVRRVNYRIESARVGRATDYERLILDVWTDGTVGPVEALSLASRLLAEHLTLFIESEEGVFEQPKAEGEAIDAELDALLSKSVDDLALSVRSTNCLKNAKIHTLRDLVRKTEKEMLETKNFGKRSLDEVLEVLEEHGLALGMNVPEPAVSG
jgi:DNA-directed RNA polymerase subunit alpha